MIESWPTGKFRCIVADPPWKYGKWGAFGGGDENTQPPGKGFTSNNQLPYLHMSIEDIADLPVGGVSEDNCDLYLWTTQKYLPDAFAILGAWGFRYCQTLVWCKAPRGTGQGGLYCPTTEFLLLGRKGKMPKGKRRIDSTWWQVTRTARHSEKPEFFQDLIETVSDGPRLELFARRPREGWTVWGNEVEASDG